MTDPECARGGGVSHILAEKRDVTFTLLKKMHENAIFLPVRGGGVRRVRPMLDPPLAIVGVPEKWIVEFGSRLMELRYKCATLH